MLTRAPIGRVARPGRGAGARRRGRRRRRRPAVLVALLVDAFRWARSTLPTRRRLGRASVGAALFRTWVLPFEVLSVLLLAALVGAIVLSRRDIGAAASDAGGRCARRGRR